MKQEIIIAGFGGQGVLSMGKILAYSGLMEDKEVTWMPAYGPEQRGGTANVTVIVSDERISSPILSQYDTAIILNQPSLEKFEGKIKPGGILIYDGYGIIEPPTRKDIQIYRIDAMDAANEKGMAKTFNMIVLGGLLKLRPVVSIESVIKALRKTLPERHHHLIPMNEEAIRIGMEIIKPIIKGRTFHSGKALPFIFILYLCRRYEKNILYYFFIIPVLPYFLDGTADNEYPEQSVRFLGKRTGQKPI